MSQARAVLASVLIGCAAVAAARAQTADGGDTELGVIPVTAPAVNPDGSTAESGGLTVLKQSFGPFGPADERTLPYSSNAVPQKLIRDQQARSLDDIVRNDPSVSVAQPSGSQSDTGFPRFNIRGFEVDFGAQRVDGLNNYSVVPPQEGIERVDVIKGSTAVLYGFSAPAGVINVITKRPLADPLTEITFGSLLNNGQFEGAADVSRRFGPDEAFGVRVNVAKEGGDGPVDATSVDRDFESLALEWRPLAGLRLWTNVFHGSNDRDGIAPYVYTAFNSPPLAHLPKPVDPTRQLDQKWAYQRTEFSQEQAGLDYDRDGWRAGLIYGHSDTRNSQRYTTAYLNDLEEYDVQPYLSDYAFHSNSVNANAGRTWDLGPLKNSVDFAFSHSHVAADTDADAVGPVSGISMLRYPTYYPLTAVLEPGPVTYRSGFDNRTILLSDRVEVGRWLTLLGGLANADYVTLSTYPGSFSQRHQNSTSPMAAFTVSPDDRVTLYGSYIAALQLGAQAPTTAKNAGEFLPPYLGTQYELGLKTRPVEGLDVNVATFLTNQAYAYLDPADNFFKAAGHQQNIGLEATATGKVAAGLTAFAGLIAQENRIVDLNPGRIVTGPGNKALGIPNFRANLFLEYEVPRVEGLTALAGLYYTGPDKALVRGKQYLSFSDYALCDVGFRYDTRISDTPVTASFYVQNLTNQAYWGGTGFGGIYLAAGSPRTFKAQLAARF